MQENKVRLYYTRCGSDKKHSIIDDKTRQDWLDELSEGKRSAITRLFNMTDQDSSLLGLRLLKYAAEDSGVTDLALADIIYPETGKPYWSGGSRSSQSRSTTARPGTVMDVDFNISHSDNLVMVVLSRQATVGIDVEKIRPLKSLAFRSVMQPHELTRIAQQPVLFFQLWSLKEAVVKAADSSGLPRMREVEIDTNGQTAMFDGRQWYLKQLSLDPLFSIALACSVPLTDLRLIPLSMDDLI